ncbi:cation:proton antiporter domain-containing protein [Microbacterium faecale]|uniref:cation:proton antiporter domain-containing protein n=1 Tax=Microbacterium faecale TaxID=1804630 RepID=UPI001666C3F6|nr:cation:proton antiporter [Microbacterium faecale]
MGNGLAGSIAITSLARRRGWPAPLVVTAVALVVSYASGQMCKGIKLRRWKHAPEAGRADPSSRPGRRIAEQKKRRAAMAVQSTAQAIRTRVQKPRLSWQERLVVSWSSMRGVVTLALAVALPDLTEHGMPDGNVETMIAVAYIVTVGTLLLQGLTLPALIRGLGVSATDQTVADNREIARMRRLSKEAGVEYLREQQERWGAKYGSDDIDAFKRFSRGLLRIEQGAERGDREIDGATDDATARRGGVAHEEFLALSKGWLAVRRRVALEQSRAGNLSEEVMREVFDAIDAEELALDTKGALRKK